MAGWSVLPATEHRCSYKTPFLFGLASGACLSAVGAALYYVAYRRRFRRPKEGEQRGDDRSSLEAILSALADISGRLKAIESKLENGKPNSRRPNSGYVTADSSLPSSDREDKFEDVNDSGSDTDIFFHAMSTPSQRKAKKGSTLSSQSLSLSSTSAPEDIESFCAQVDVLLDGDSASKRQAFDMLTSKFLMHQDEAELMWRLSRATFLMSQLKGCEGDLAAKRELAFRARELAFQALELDGSSGDVHKWCALTIGNLGDYVSVADKIRNGLVFKEHILEAIRLKPADPVCHHLLGRWYYGVYMITWMERQVASALVSNVPSATVDQALDKFLKVEELKPNQWKENMLFVAKCYVEMRCYADAASWLRRAEALPISSSDDKEAHQQVLGLLTTYGGY